MIEIHMPFLWFPAWSVAVTIFFLVLAYKSLRWLYGLLPTG